MPIVVYTIHMSNTRVCVDQVPTASIGAWTATEASLAAVRHHSLSSWS